MSDGKLWLCHECGSTFESDDTRHSMDYCYCEDEWVDHEDVYIRRSMNVECIGRSDVVGDATEDTTSA